jgi:hypothetical protein
MSSISSLHPACDVPLDALLARLIRARAAEVHPETERFNFLELRGMAFGVLYEVTLSARTADERTLADAIWTRPDVVLGQARDAVQALWFAQEDGARSGSAHVKPAADRDCGDRLVQWLCGTAPPGVSTDEIVAFARAG